MTIQDGKKIAAVLTCLTLLASAGCYDAPVRGSGGVALAVKPAKAVEIQRGKMQTLEIAIDRQGFHEAVEVALLELPAGVKADHASKSIEADKATFILSANDAADLVVNHRAKIVATGPGDMKTTQYLTVTVTQ